MIRYDEKVINEIRDLLLEKKQTVSVAESVTSGHLQAAFSLAIDASQFYQGGITAYNLGQKTRHLNIEPVSAMQVNCVNDKICRDMALSVQALFISNYSIGITGYASIVPQCEKEGLNAFIEISYEGKIIFSGKLVSQNESPLQVQLDYTNQALGLLLDSIKKEQAMQVSR